MIIFFCKRVLFVIPVFFAVTFVTFALIHAVPGGPFDNERELLPSIRQKLEEKYGFNRPLWQQYIRYIDGMFHGDLGPSYHYNDWNVAELMSPKVKVSLELGFYGMVLALLLGISGGIISVRYLNAWPDKCISFLSTMGLCLPSFIVGPLLVYIFGIYFRWFDVAGWDDWGQKILPTLTVGLLYAASIAQLTKGGLMEEMNRPYVLAARARGISERRILWIHVLRNGLLPVIAYLGPTFAGLISGAIVTETVFQIPGMGRLFIQAIRDRDSMLILGIVNFYSCAVILCNAIADCIQAWLNPKVRLQ